MLIYRLAAFISLGAVVVGYDSGLIATIAAEERWIALMKPTNDCMSLVSLGLLGAVLGALYTGNLADVYGRERLLALSSLTCSRSTGPSSVSEEAPVQPVYPSLYLSEIVPRTLRGRLIAIARMGSYFGQLVGFLMGFYLRRISTMHWWRIAFVAQYLAVSVFGLGCLIWVLPSPRWLVAQGRDDCAHEVLRRLHGQDSAVIELRQIRETMRLERHVQASWGGMWKKPILRLTILSCGIQIFLKVTGAYSLMFYTPSLFEKAGLSFGIAYFAGTVDIISVMFHVTWIPFAWFYRLGRNTWLQVGTIGMILSLVAIAALQRQIEQYPDWKGRYIVVLFPYLFYIFYNISWAVALATYSSEIFPLSMRAKGNAISISVFYAVEVSTSRPPVLGKAIGWRLNLLYAMACVLTLGVVRFALVETKNQSLEEMDQVVGLEGHFAAAEGTGAEQIELVNRERSGKADSE
ncbi:hypothetical protein BJY01DRAFT_259694 [Aspergillus pseudoustus]|uniref:Major facilitator superfamily (MFS) profile domain-containing protein n=1 Tax=Aspergillus pseudoustus TaxID=1810923 RepID=A0ABR4J1X3_9EURO